MDDKISRFWRIMWLSRLQLFRFNSLDQKGSWFILNTGPIKRKVLKYKSDSKNEAKIRPKHNHKCATLKGTKQYFNSPFRSSNQAHHRLDSRQSTKKGTVGQFSWTQLNQSQTKLSSAEIATQWPHLVYKLQPAAGPTESPVGPRRHDAQEDP